MSPPDARLLVTVGRREGVEAALARELPGVPAAFPNRDDSGPWPAVEAWIVGTPRRDLPHWRAAATPRLRFVQRLFTGLDEFPFSEFPPDVAIAGNVGAYARLVAEHTMALLLAACRDLLDGDRKVRAGVLRPAASNRYLGGTTVLLLGFGEIARETAARLRPFGVHLNAVTRRGEPLDGVERVYAADRLAAAASAADAIIECRPLPRETRATLDRSVLERMKPDAVLVNVGRAGTVHEADLFAHLSTHPLFRAALDVWWQEDFERGTVGSAFPFVELPNVIGTPHVAAIGSAALRRSTERAVANVARFFRGEPPRHVADRRDYVEP